MRSVLSLPAARRLARLALFGGGGAGALGAGLYGFLQLEGLLARRSIGVLANGAPHADGTYGAQHSGRPLSLAVIGDSVAAGLGVDDGDETPGALLAAGLAEIAERPVRLCTTAYSGARSEHLLDQVDVALLHDLDAALIVVGGNDVTHQVRPSTAMAYLNDALSRLHDDGVTVVVGTCPDLGTVEPIPQPLRWLARQLSRQFAAAQMVTTIEAGARGVSLSSILGAEFSSAPGDMFASDRFHPSAAGYAAVATALLPALAHSLDLWTDEDDDYVDGATVLPVGLAAETAVEQAGAEVAGTTVGGRDRGPLGRWARLRRRVRTDNSVTAPAAAENSSRKRAQSDR